jgi:hypothetical protein
MRKTDSGAADPPFRGAPDDRARPPAGSKPKRPRRDSSSDGGSAAAGLAVGLATGHVAPKPPVGKPVASLQRLGFHGPIEHFNHRVQATIDAHRAARGFDPPPGVVLDVARSQVPDDKIGELFGASVMGARVGKAVSGLDPKFRDINYDRGADLLNQFKQAAKGGHYEQFWKEHGEEIQELGREDPEFQSKFATANVGAYGGLAPPKLKGLHRVAAFALRGVGQVTEGLVLGPPTLAVHEGKALGEDVGAVVRGEKPTSLVKTNVRLGKAVVEGVKEDVRHPGENPGYLFLDALGLVSAGAGTAARVGAAGKALARGEAGAAAKALVKQPRPGTATLRKGGLEEEVLLSQNAAVRTAQRLTVRARNARMKKRLDGDASAGALSIVRPAKAQELLDRVLDPLRGRFSSENKLAREARARKRVETQIAMTPWRELQAAAGWSSNSAPIFRRINDRLPKQARGGLTIGEQKAIQVLATDDANPLALHRSFHEKMLMEGIGDVDAHRGHLAALKMAEKVLQDPNPRERFRKALAITRGVIAEQEAIKIRDLGLTPEIAERRVISQAEVMRTGKPVEDLEGTRQRGDSFYLPAVSKARTRRQGAPTAPARRDAGFGLSPGRDLPELNHVFTGKSILAGDFRIDATNLAGESYARTVRRATVLNEHKRLWTAASDRPRSEFDRPIRDTTAIPEKLREFLSKAEEGVITGKEAEALSKSEMDDLLRLLYPGRQNERNGRWELDEPIEGVRWVDSRLLDLDRLPASSTGKKIAQAINEPFRITTLFLRPAYVLNALGNAGMAVLHQGHHAPPNMLRAFRAKDLYGEKVARTLDALVGEGRARSYVGDVDTVLTKTGRNLAGAWSVLTDRHFRRAALIHELRQLGFKTREEIEGVLFSPDGEAVKKRVEATRRANKAMVEFDNLTWFEKEYLRNLVFVYPWVSRSTVWSLRSIVEHPIKADVLAQIGHEADQEHPDIFNRVPEWFAKTGYIPIGFDKDGNPKVVNATSVNSFSTLGQLTAIPESGLGDYDYGTLEEIFGPAAKFGLHAASGRDEYGNPYPGSDWFGAAKEVLLLGLPQARALERSKKENADLKAIDVTDRRTLVERERSALKRTVFSPGWADGFGMLMTGGLTARVVDPDGLAAR